MAYGLFDSAKSYADAGRSALDEKGIPTFDYGKAYDNLGRWHNPFYVARYAEALYRDWHATGCSDRSLKNKFLLQANWLADHKEDVKGMALWAYPFPNTYFGVAPGWISGISQSHIAGVLYRAHRLSGKERFRSIGRRALEPYFRPMSEGGVVTQSEAGFWVQEVASPTGKMFNILNGHITGIIGLADVAQFERAEELNNLVEKGIDSVRISLAKFDAGFASFYSLGAKEGDDHRVAARHGYNLLHISQMLMLYEIDGDPAFLKMAMRLQGYETQDDRRLAKGSTDPKKHGPEEASAFYGARFWSHNTFPTRYEVRMDEAPQLDGIYLGGYIEKAAPKAFTVSVLADGVWREAWSATDNKEKNLFLKFVEPVTLAGIRLDVESDNGNNNVAMNAVMPVRSSPEPDGVTNYCNYQAEKKHGGMGHSARKALDQDPQTRIVVHCDGYVVLPPTEGSNLVIKSAGDPSQAVKILTSRDLRRWQEVGHLSPGDETGLRVPRGEYLRLVFDKRIRWIDGVSVSGSPDRPSGIPENPSEIRLIPARFEPGFRSD